MVFTCTSQALGCRAEQMEPGLSLVGACRYYHPCPPTKATIKAERTFEGISLDVPGQSSKTTSAMTRFQLCENCYLAEARCAPDRLTGSLYAWMRLMHQPKAAADNAELLISLGACAVR